MRERLVYLESLRGFAAIAVALFHFSNSSFLTENPFIHNAETMVDFFFVLSGFVIAYNYFDRIVDLSSLVDFQVKRFWRLYPLHLVCLLGFLGLEAAQYAYELSSGSACAALRFRETLHRPCSATSFSCIRSSNKT